MKTLYLDLSMGAAGDMLTAALLELHDRPENVLEMLNNAFAGKAVLSAQKDSKHGIAGTHVTVHIDGEVESAVQEDHKHHHHHHTSITEVRNFIGGLDLPKAVLQNALAVYDLIAEAEAHVHGQSMENIHFHEIGTLDAMADVTAVCYLMYELDVGKVFASPVHVGSGTVRCTHGVLPVPAPATQELLKDIPIYSADIEGELCTPTGAALLRHFVSDFGPIPQMRVKKVGYGLGTKDFPRANGLRVLLGETDDTLSDQVLELACNLDDMTGEELAFAQERLFDAGALDVYFTQIGMKKSRPGVILSCICRAGHRDEILTCLFRHTTTLGVREYICSRHIMSRTFTTCETSCGPVQIKRASGYGVVREKPEYEDLKKIAEKQNLSLQEVRQLLKKS